MRFRPRLKAGPVQHRGNADQLLALAFVFDIAGESGLALRRILVVHPECAQQKSVRIGKKADFQWS